MDAFYAEEPAFTAYKSIFLTFDLILEINFSVRIAVLMQLQLFFNKEIEKFNLDRIESSSVYFSAPCSLFSLSRMEIMLWIHYGDHVRG
jgi:hypothetical protein